MSARSRAGLGVISRSHASSADRESESLPSERRRARTASRFFGGAPLAIIVKTIAAWCSENISYLGGLPLFIVKTVILRCNHHQAWTRPCPMPSRRPAGNGRLARRRAGQGRG